MSTKILTVGRLLLAAVSASLLLAACESMPRTRSDYDPTADFSAYKTFGFVSAQADFITVAATLVAASSRQLRGSRFWKLRSYGQYPRPS